MNLFGVMVFQTSMLDWRREVGVNLPYVYVHHAIYISVSRSAKFGIMVFKASLLKSGGQSAIDPCYTITPPMPIDHRSMLHNYTSLPIDHRSMLHHYTT